MNKLKLLIGMMPVVMVISTRFAFAGSYDRSDPWFKTGGSAGFFRISYDNFTSVYQHRWGYCYGGFVAVKAIWGIHLSGKFKQFQMDGRDDLANWQEKWYNIGFRKYSSRSDKMQTFYGFGVSIFRVQEHKVVALVLPLNDDGTSKKGNGFFMELGVQRQLGKFTGMFFEIEITSAGIGGNTVLEGQSIGGIFAGFGISFQPF